MKHFFKRFALLATVVLTSVMVVACNKTTAAPTAAPTTVAPTTAATPTTAKQDLSVLNGFTASVEGIYTVSADTATELHFTYNKGEEAGAYLKKAVSGLAGFNNLEITVKEAGNFKVELYAGDDSISVSIQSSTTGAIVNWNLRNDQDVLAKVTEIRIYAGPDKIAVTGELHFTQLSFTTVLAGEGGEYIMNKGDSTIPTTTVDYTGEDTVDMLDKFQENDAGTYAFTYNEDGSVDIDVTTAGYPWGYFYNQYSAIPATFTLMTLTLKGKAGTSILIKPDDNVGGDNWYTIQEDDKAETIYVPVTAGVKKILFFVNPNTESDVKLTFVSGILSEGVSTKIANGNVLSGYVDNGDGAYTLSETDGVVSATFNQGGWSYFSALTSSFAQAGSENLSLKVTVNGTVGDKVLVKINDKIETWHTIEASDTDESFMISGEGLQKFISKVLVFINGGADPRAEGEMDIKIEVVEALKEQTTVEYTEGALAVDCNDYWFDGGNSAYTFEKAADGSYTITVDKKDQYAWFGNTYTGFEETSLTNMVLVVKGTSGAQLGIKPNDDGTFQQYVNMTGEVQTVQFKVPAAMAKMIIFYNINDATATGSFTIYDMYMYGDTEAITGLAGNPDETTPVYTVTEADGVATVAWTKTGAWQWFGVDGLTVKAGSVLGIMIKGTAGTALLVKPNDNGSYEQTITLTGEWQFVVLTNVPDTITRLVMFMDGALDASTGTAQMVVMAINPAAAPEVNKFSGSVDLKVGSFDINHYWKADTAETAYVITENADKSFTVEAQTSKGEWSWFAVKVSEVTNEFKYLKLVVNGASGNKILVKPNDDGAYQKEVTLTGEDQVVYVAIPENMAKVIMFMAPGTQIAATQSLVIKEALLVGEVVAKDAYVTGFASRETITVSSADNNVTLKYTVDGWIYTAANVYGDTTGLVLQVTVASAGATKVLVKLNDTLETWVELIDGVGSATISGDKLPASMTSILLFPDGGLTVATETTVEITLQWVEAE